MTELVLQVGERVGQVSALLELPRNARALYVLAHGAGAGMRHRFLQGIAAGLAERAVGTLRYQFPYMEAGGRRPDPPGVLEATVRAAVARAAAAAPGLPLLAGGKSLGGRMTSGAAAKCVLPGVRGLVFLGFPLHAPGKAGVGRAAHLERVQIPMLFLQGTRDALADLDLVKSVTSRLPGATLHVVEGGDHSFAVLKRSGRTETEVMGELMDTIVDWMSREGIA
jgi:predicted alpha/beta-hydrolase family hydrolase